MNKIFIRSLFLLFVSLYSNSVFADSRVLDDSRSVLINSNPRFEFEDISNKQNNNLSSEFQVKLHLDTTEYRGMNCRIFIKLSDLSNYEGLTVKWFGGGFLINSEFTGNNRSLIYSGLINGNEIVDYLNFKMIKNNNFKVNDKERFKFIFEIEC